MKRTILVGFLIFIILFMSFASAILYSEAIPDPNKFDSITQVWDATLVINDREIRLGLNEYNFTFNYTNKSIILGRLSDSKETYLIDSILYLPYEDSKIETYYLGCLDGASFSQKFGELFKILFGGKPYSISYKEEQEFEKEGRAIENTPGTGAYNAKACTKNCMEQRSEGDCEIASNCPMTKEQRDAFEKCLDDCTMKFKCGDVVKCNNFAPDGSCVIKQVDLWVSQEHIPYQISLYFNAKTGLIDKAVVNGKKTNKVIEQGTTKYYLPSLFRRTLSANDVNWENIFSSNETSIL